MKTVIVCGLLGSGKTTFIRNFIFGSSDKTVVLVNDFGKTGIDGEIFSADGIESVELPSGCVCCTLKLDFITEIRKIREIFSPDRLIIEPSGIASPAGVLEALDILNISPVSAVGVVDATEFLELLESEMYGSFFYEQVMNADIILVNKADLAGVEKVQLTISRIGEMNPKAVVMRSVNGIPEDLFPGIVHERQPVRRQKVHFSFDSLSCRFLNIIPLTEITLLFDRIASGAFGRVARAKALLQTTEGPYRFDISFGKVNKEELGKEVDEGRLVVIGENLLKKEIALAIKEIGAQPSLH